MSFYNDLEFGKIWELKFANLTNQPYEISEGKTDWDVKINNIKYEVKTDRLMNKTGNFCIEYEHNYKPSGIFNTSSKYWVFIEIINFNKDNLINYNYDFNLYVIPTKDLKNIILDDKVSKTKNTTNYTDLTKFYLIKKSYFRKYKILDFTTPFYIYKKQKKQLLTPDEIEKKLVDASKFSSQFL